VMRFVMLVVLVASSSAESEPGFGHWIPQAAGWMRVWDTRLKQVAQMESSQERFDGYINTALSGMLVPNYTANGFVVVKQPPGVHDRLKAALHKGLNGRVGNEGKVDQISGPLARFVSIGNLGHEILNEMKQAHEEWVGGLELLPTQSYGLRVYQPGNSLTMHTDHISTHVVSSILHVDRDVDEPWPIVIEGYDGVTHEVDLQPGEMLYYESAKCVHGRPRPMKGRYYASLFMHYRPKTWNLKTQDAIDSFGDDWRDQAVVDGSVPELRMRGTGFYEPGCKHDWCNLASVWPPEGASKEL